MSIHSVEPQPRVPPIKLLGARRALLSLAYGAVLGPLVGFIVSILFSPGATTEGVVRALVVMSLVFGLFLGPVMTLGAASMLAVAGFARSDFAAAGWARLIGFAVLGCGVGIGVGFMIGVVFLQIVTAGDAVLFLFAMIGGILGFLVAGSVLVGNAANRRIGRADLQPGGQG